MVSENFSFVIHDQSATYKAKIISTSGHDYQIQIPLQLLSLLIDLLTAISAAGKILEIRNLSAKQPVNDHGVRHVVAGAVPVAMTTDHAIR
jgi:hypothetical protein